MLISMRKLFGYSIEARDGRIGKVEDFYFDDYVWRVRYLVAGTGGWLVRNSVLISPAAVDTPRLEEKSLPVKLTKDQVRNSPEIDTDKPVSRQMEESIQSYYGWPSYWSMEPFVMAATPEVAEGVPAALVEIPSGDPHLRSVQEVTGYEVRALDRESSVGTVSDFVLDDEEWTVRYVVVESAETKDREFVLNPWWSRDIDWAKRAMHFDIPSSQIDSSPDFDEISPFDRAYERKLHDYYGREGYWERLSRQ